MTAKNLMSIERSAEADGASLAVDLWDSYHRAAADQKDGVAEKAARDYENAVTDDYDSQPEQAAFTTGFIRRMLELTQIPKWRDG